MISKRVLFALLLAVLVGAGQAEEPKVGVKPAGQNLPSYRVQPGDVMTISVWKETELQSEVLVRPDGYIGLRSMPADKAVLDRYLHRQLGLTIHDVHPQLAPDLA